MARAVLALDIGGANLKAAHSGGSSRLQPFELWKNPAGLAGALHGLVREWPPFDLLAVTMTGELCDCFAGKRQGVNAILDAVDDLRGDLPARVWRNDGRLVEVAVARMTPLQTAAANWLALATFAGRYAPTGEALLVDIGSTTTDIIPLKDGRPIPCGRTDPERLRSGELVYTGVRRTPLCALLGAEAAAEWFATTLDVYLLLGDLPEDADDHSTADGRPATRAAAHGRLAHMMCADSETCTEDEAQQMAQQAALRQAEILGNALERVRRHFAHSPATVILAGSGEFLVRKVLRALPAFAAARYISLADLLGPEVSQSACAYALAVLAMEDMAG